jgi:hypothetical protein
MYRKYLKEKKNKLKFKVLFNRKSSNLQIKKMNKLNK